MADTLLVVEGPADARFIIALVRQRFNIDLKKDHIIEIRTNGRSINDQVMSLIQTRTDSLRKSCCIILDSDRATDRTRDTVIQAFSSRGMELDSERLFLLPNDDLEGNLETLLLPIISSTHGERIFNCYQNYYQCLAAIDTDFGVEDPKEKLYVYSKLLSDEGNETKRNYLNADLWNLDHPSLEPLVQFLQNHLTS